MLNYVTKRVTHNNEWVLAKVEVQKLLMTHSNNNISPKLNKSIIVEYHVVNNIMWQTLISLTW